MTSAFLGRKEKHILRNLKGITVRRAIIHQVAPKQGKLVLSERALPLDADVFSFLGAHVQAGLHDPQGKAVRFVVHGADRTADLCDQLLASPDEFVRASQGLARRLNEVSQGDKRISDGALAVLICDATEPHDKQFVALLKLDPANGYRPVEVTDQEGKAFIQLELAKDILPSERERLQKAAFVQSETPDQEFRILALDRQTAPEPAQFFVGKFLGAEFVLDAEARTERLYRSLIAARNEVGPGLKSGQLIALEKVIEGTMASASVNLDEVMGSLPVPESVRSKVDEIVSAALPDREFDLDSGLGKRLVLRRVFEADNRVRVVVPAEFFDQMINVKDVPNTDPVVRLVTIRTERWEER